MSAEVKKIVVKSNEAIENKNFDYFSNLTSQVTLRAKDPKKRNFRE